MNSFKDLLTCNSVIFKKNFLELFFVNVNHVIIKKNMHKYNVTYYKYDSKKCRFKYFKIFMMYSKANEHDIMKLKRNNE